MDFKSMKRKELQALCKEHGLPANSTNSQMIESLSSIFQENIKPKGCLKGSGGSSAEDLGILRGGTKKVTFVIQDEEEDESEEFTVKPVGNSKRKSVGRKSSVAPEVEKRSEKTEKNSRSESRKDALEVPRRTSRSNGLAGAVLWSPVVEKRKKKSGDGTEGVRKNTESTSSKEKDIFGEVPVTRSLRNRAVVGGGNEVLVTDQNPRTQKRKNSDKKEENEKAAAVLLEDETIGRKNLRKRYREGDSVEDEPPCRRSSRAKLGETVATEEIDVGRSKKQRRGGTETSLIEKVVANDIERISKPGGTAKRSRGNVLDCNAVGSGDVNDATGQKKARSQGNNRASKQDDSTDSMSDVEAVTGATRRSTRSSSALSEVGKSVSAVGKSDQEGEAVRKSKSRKQVKDRGPRGAEPASLLPDSEVVVEPIKRSPRASSTLLEDGTSVTVVGKSVGGEVVRKGKSLKQAKDHNLKGGSTVSMLDSEVVAEPVRRSTRSSSTLLLDQTSLPLAGKSVKGGEVVRKGKSQKQQDGPKVCLTALSPDTEVVAEPLRRSTRSSSTLLEDVTSLPVVGKLVKGGKVDRKGKSEKQVKDDGSNGGGSITSLPDCEVVADPPRRSTRSSSNLLEDVTSLPVVGKSVKGGDAVRKGKSQRQAKDHASTGGGSTASLPESEVIVEPVRRSKRNSSSLLENVTSLPVLGKSVKESEAVRKGKSQKQANDHAWGGGVSTASLSDNEVVAESTKRLTRSSSKLLEDESHLSATGKSGGDDVAIRNYKPGKQQKDCASKQGDSTASLLDTETVTTPTRILTRSSKFFGNEIVSPVVGKLGDTVSQENSWKHERDHTSGRPLLNDRAVTTPTRRSTRSSSKLLEDETLLKAETLGDDNEVRKDKSGKPSKNCALKHGCSSALVPHNASVMTPARSSTHSSSKLLEDGITLEFGKLVDENEAIKLGKMSKNSASGKKSKNSAIKQGEIVGRCGNGGAMEVGSTSSQRKSSRKAPADSGFMQRQCSPDPASSLLEDIQNDSCVKGKSSGKKASYVKQSSHVLEKEVDIRRTSIGCHTLQEQDILSDNKVPASKSTPAIGAAEEISVLGPPTAALSFSLSIAVDSGSGETEISNDVDNKIISEMKQSPANVQFQKIENSTSLVGALKDLDDVCLHSNIKQFSFMEIAIKGRGELPLNNITEGSSEVQENVLRKVDTAVEAEGTLESYGDDGSKAPSPVDPTSTINANNGETSVGALDDEDGLTGMESQNFTSQPVSLLSSEEQSTIFHTEISAMAHLKEPDSAEEVDVVHEDIMTGYGARQITTPRFSPSSEEQYLASDTEASPGLAREESNVEVEICGATEDGVADNVATDISGPTSVCKRSEELSPTLNTDSSPEVDLEEPESEDKLDGSSEDVVAGNGATKIIDPVTSDSEVFPEASCKTNVGKSDSEVEVHVANNGHIEGIEATKTAVSPFSFKSDEVLSPNLLPTLLNEISPNIYLREPDLKVETHAMKMASRSDDFLGEASDPSSKTLEALATARRDAGDSCNIQRNFDNEMESCKADPDNILNAELASGICDARKIIEASAGDSDSQLKVIKETWVSSALSVTVSDGIETEDGTNDVEKNEDEVRPSSPSDNTPFDAIYIPTCGLTETPTMLGCEDSTKQVGMQDFPHVPDSEDARHLSDQQGGVLNVTESLVASDRSPKSAPKEHEALEQLNGVADSLPETVNTVNELTDVEFEKGVELGAVDAEEMENMKSLESVASVEGDSNTVTKKADIIVFDKFDHSDEVGQTQEEAVFLQEVKGSSGELHTVGAASHPSLENSASIPGEVRFPSPEIFSLSTYMENAPSLPKMDAILSVAEQLNEDNTEKASEEEEILNNVEFPSPVSFSPLVNQEESQDSATLEKNTFSGGSLGFTVPPGTYLADSHNVGGQSNDENEVGAKMELRLPCNVHEELDNQKSPFAALTQSCKEERTQVSSIKSESVPEAREKHTELSASKSTYPVDTLRCEDYNTRSLSSIKSESVPEARETHTEMSASKSTYPVDTLRCEEAGLCKKNLGSTKSVDKPEENYNTRTVYVTVLSEPGSEYADNTNNDNDLLEKYSEAEHGVDHGIKMSVFGMAQDSVATGISENTEASSVGDQPLVKECLAKVVVDSSTKSQTPGEESNKYQGTLECFEQGSNVEKSWVEPGVTQMFVEALFHMDSEVASFVNDDAQVGRVGHHVESLAHGKCENFLEINTAETLATEEPEMKAVAVSGNSPTAGNFSGSSAEPIAGMDSQATRSTEQSDGQEGRKIFIRETSEVSQFTKDELFTVLDGIKIEGSATVVSKSETIEITPIPEVAKQEELIARNCTELLGSNAAHHVLCDWKERSGIERRPTGNELGESKFRGTSTAQHALFSLDSGAVRGSSTTVQEESISKDERMAPEEYFGDFGWAFGEDVDFGSSYHEVQHVDSQLPTESALGNSADHSSKSVIDVNEEQNKTSELDQTEDSKECVQSTPLQLDINVKPGSVIDDATRNKENTVGLKMDSALRHSEKPRISNSSRQPLQSVRRTKDEH